MAYRINSNNQVPVSVTYDTKDGGTLTVLIIYDQNASPTTPGVAQLYSAGYRNGLISLADLTKVGGYYLYKDAAEAYKSMSAAATQKGITLIIADTYRALGGEYGQINTVGKKGWYGRSAPKDTTQVEGLAAQPGTSNHGWGLAIDFDQSFVWQTADGNGSSAHNWLAINAANFGFSRDRKEPWHWNYVKPLEMPIQSSTNKLPDVITPKPPTVIPATPTAPTDVSDYINTTYKQPFRDVKPSQAGIVDPTAVSAGTFNNNYQTFLNEIQTESPANSKTRIGPLLTGLDSIQGDLILIRGLTAAQTSVETKATNVVNSTLSTYNLTAKQDLVTSQIFELSPDRMRIKMAQTADTPNGTSHAWRAPGKLSITADITILGMSGLRIAEMFWIDRVAENYKKFGAFQIFGITEHIDIGKGWTTSLHSRFNALSHKLLDQKQLYDDEAPSNPTTTNPTQATPTTP
jgi:hypothetical protein